MTTQTLDINSSYEISGEQKAFYAENGYVKLKNVLSKEVLDYYGEEITNKVFELNKQEKPIGERDTYGKAFLQVGNLWEQSNIVKEFVLGKRLAKIATDLMNVSGVRLYHSTLR